MVLRQEPFFERNSRTFESSSYWITYFPHMKLFWFLSDFDVASVDDFKFTMSGVLRNDALIASIQSKNKGFLEKLEFELEYFFECEGLRHISFISVRIIAF